MGKALLGMIALSIVCGSVGCSGAGSWVTAATEKVPYFGKKKAEEGFALGGGPDFSKSYEELSSEYQQRNVMSPAIGLDGDIEPSRTTQWTRAVTDNSVTRTVKSAFKTSKDKAADLVMPRKGPPPSTISVASGVGEPTAELFLSAARMYETAGDLPAAEVQYRRALQTDPQNLTALLGCAHVCDRQMRLSEATALYTQAAESHPNQAAPLNDLGLCLARQHKLPEAAQSLQKAVALQPNRKLYRNNVATVLVELGRVDEAHGHLASVHGAAVAHNNIGYLLHKLGDTTGSARHYALAAQLDPSMNAAGQYADEVSRRAPTANPAAPAPQATGRQATPAPAAPRYQSRVPAGTDARTVPPQGPINLPEWSQSADQQPHAAAPPVPDGIDRYQPVGPGPVTAPPVQGDLLKALPPIDPAYIPQSRY